MSIPESNGIEAIEKELSISFRNKELLQQALTHSTFVNEPRNVGKGSNESLATLGDAVVGLAVVADLYDKSKRTKVFHFSAKGDLTVQRSKIVNDEQLAILARKAHLDQHLLASEGQRKAGINTTVLAQTYEALIGAIFLDLGYERAATFVKGDISLLAG